MTVESGWLRIGPDPAIAAWAAAALPVAEAAIAASPEPWRCGETWFVGVDALPNGPDGRMGDAPFPWASLPLTPVPLHRAQLSTVRPGYPRPWAGEDEAAFGFRLRRDAAHLDGPLPTGPDRQRQIKEPHAWVLGLPLNECGAAASPLVVWEGSPAILRAALQATLAGHDPDLWGGVDLTDAYKAARAEVFRRCRRVELPALPGEAILLHRLTIHGVAPWEPDATAPAPGRIIAYFRPCLPSVQDWLARP
ncbi:hypothetical protein [Rhodobacter sp. Har01]|uniref:hypothetical protein n=1 Tax=Rhodobacter sp. Har01 TaxID=2883999 RepID=UPI0029CA3277|nr:hypothetical protein [Rhodobacter sp. Har01]